MLPCVGGEGRLEVAGDVAGIARSRRLHVLRQVVLVVQVFGEHLVGEACYLRRSWYVVELIRVEIRQAKTLSSQTWLPLTLLAARAVV